MSDLGEFGGGAGGRSLRADPLYALWAGVALLAVVLSVGVVEQPTLVAATAILAVGAGIVVSAFVQPRWALLVQLALLWAYVIDALRQQFEIPITTETLVIIILGAVLFRWALGVEAPEFPLREIAIVTPLFVWLLVSTAFAGDPARSMEDVIEFVENVFVLGLMVVLLDSLRWLRRAAWTIVAAAAALAALAVFQQLAGSHAFNYYGFATIVEDRSLARSAGPLDPNFFGEMLVLTSLLALYLGLSADSARTRRLAFGVFALEGVAIVFTFSRGSALALAIALLVAAVLRHVRPWIPIGAAAAAVLLGALFLPSDAKERFAETAQPASTGVEAASDGSLKGRFSENVAAVLMFVDHPLVGVGPDNFPARYTEYSQEIGLDSRAKERTPHNVYLEYLAETGLPGLVAFLVVIGAALAGAWRARRRLPERDALLAEGIFVALVGFLVNAVFLHAAYSRYLWIGVGLAFVAGRLSEPRRAA